MTGVRNVPATSIEYCGVVPIPIVDVKMVDVTRFIVDNVNVLDGVIVEYTNVVVVALLDVIAEPVIVE